jgi:kinesin family protein 2/24
MKIEKMEAEREERRRAMQERKIERAQEATRQKAAGITGDVDFNSLIGTWRDEHQSKAKPHAGTPAAKIVICVRKRPISEKEVYRNDHDCITCFNPVVWVHSSKLRVDGINKYLDHSSFSLDHAFDETCSTEDIYHYSTMPLLDFTLSGKGGRATVFAYGQTGSGKVSCGTGRYLGLFIKVAF